MKQTGLYVLVAILIPATAFAETAEIPSYGWLLTKTILVLVGICFLAVFGIRLLAKLNNRNPDDRMRVVSRLAIEPRRSVYVVKIGSRGIIIGSSEQGMSSLGELTPEELRGLEPEELPNDRVAPVEATS